MRPTLSFLLLALLSFGATHLTLSAFGAGRALSRATSSERTALRPPPTSPAAAVAAAPCRQVRVVYAGSVRPPSDGCVATP
jgi:hypothetical protein